LRFTLIAVAMCKIGKLSFVSGHPSRRVTGTWSTGPFVHTRIVRPLPREGSGRRGRAGERRRKWV